MGNSSKAKAKAAAKAAVPTGKMTKSSKKAAAASAEVPTEKKLDAEDEIADAGQKATKRDAEDQTVDAVTPVSAKRQKASPGSASISRSLEVKSKDGSYSKVYFELEFNSSESDEEPAKKPAAKPVAAVAKYASKKGKPESISVESSDGASSDNDDKPIPIKPSVTVAQKKKEESESSFSDSEDSDDEVPPKPKPPAADTKKDLSRESESDSDSEDEDEPAKKADSKMKAESSDDSDSDDSDAEPPQKKQKDTSPIAAKKASIGDESGSNGSEGESDEDSEQDEEPPKTPKKKAPVPTSEKETAIKEPKTPMSTQRQATGSKTLFMANVPFRAELEDMKEFFEAAGKVLDVRFPVYEDGSRKGFCYVEFVSAEAAKKALEEMNGQEMQGRAVRLDFAQERNAYTPRSGNDAGSFQKPARGNITSVFIRGFDKSLEEDKIRSSLEQHFGGCGEITRVSIPTDYSGAVKGIAYLDFSNQDSVTKAIELTGTDLGGYELFVDAAKPKGDGQRGGGRSGGRSGGRFGDRSGGSGGRFGDRSVGRRGGGGRFGDRSGGRDGGRFGRGGGRGGNRGGGRGFGRQTVTPSGKKITFGDD